MKPIKARTPERAAMLRRLVGELRNGELTRSEASALCSISPLCVCRCFFELTALRLVAVVGRIPTRPGSASKPIYRLTDDQSAVEFFLASLETVQRVSKPAILSQPKLHSGPPAPDPYALPAAFFSSTEVRA